MAEPSKSLDGKRIVVTRAPEQSSELMRALSDQGAEVFSLPLVRFAPLQDFASLDRELQGLAEFDAVLFLSANAARYVLDRCTKLGIAIESACWPPLIAAVGPATERAIATIRLRVDYVAREHTGEALARELQGRLAGRSVLLPRSDRGDDAVPRALREIGALVTDVVAYRTALPERIDAAIAGRVRNGNVDAVVFASPSAVRNFTVVFGAQTLASLANKIGFAAIGPTTAKALRTAKLPVTIEASDSSVEGMANAIMKFYQKQTVRQAR